MAGFRCVGPEHITKQLGMANFLLGKVLDEVLLVGAEACIFKLLRGKLCDGEVEEVELD